MMELKDTVELMTSDDCKERFRAEYWQTCIRKRKLADLLKRWERGELDFKPTCSRELLERQWKAMNEYLLALKERALVEHIDLYQDVKRCAEGETDDEEA